MGSPSAPGRGRGPELEARQLHVFVALVDQGSVTVAAQSLGIAQSTASEALAALERVLGVRLVARRRGAQRVVLTPAGEALLPHARGVLAAIEAARAAVAAASAQARATIDIIANESVSTYLLPSTIATLRARWPNTRLRVSSASCAEVRAGVASGRFDVGLLLEHSFAETGASGALERVVLDAAVPLVIFAAPGHPLLSPAAAPGVHRDLLEPYPLFISDADGDFPELIHRFFGGDGVPGPQLQAAGSIEGVKRGVTLNRSALGLLPTYALADELRAGTLVALPVRPEPPRMRLEALLSSSRSRHLAQAELLTALRVKR